MGATKTILYGNANKTTDTSVSISYIDDTDALYRFLIESNGGDKL